METIGSNTSLTIGLVITLAGAVWWAAVIQTKLDALFKLLNSQKSDTDKLNVRINRLLRRIMRLESKEEK
jgi:hypothetical protein